LFYLVACAVEDRQTQLSGDSADGHNSLHGVWVAAWTRQTEQFANIYIFRHSFQWFQSMKHCDNKHVIWTTCLPCSLGMGRGTAGMECGWGQLLWGWLEMGTNYCPRVALYCICCNEIMSVTFSSSTQQSHIAIIPVLWLSF